MPALPVDLLVVELSMSDLLLVLHVFQAHCIRSLHVIVYIDHMLYLVSRYCHR